MNKEPIGTTKDGVTIFLDKETGYIASFLTFRRMEMDNGR